MPSAFQDWVQEIPIMQQSVLMSAVRGPDGTAKDHPVKLLMRWLRRSILLSAFDGAPILDPYAPGGGSFTGPIPPDMTLNDLTQVYLRHIDSLPFHFNTHILHAAEIIGYHHPDPRVSTFWWSHYEAMCRWMHLNPEHPADFHDRLSDSEVRWRAHESRVTLGRRGRE